VRLEIHPQAEAELLHGATWYEAERVGLGDEFLAHLYRWFEVIVASPNQWPRWPDTPVELDPVIRRVVVDRFPYMIGYQTFADHVLVLTASEGA
jgi:toxin ParE1/3/4